MESEINRKGRKTGKLYCVLPTLQHSNAPILTRHFARCAL
jgi:hypothetical protein